MNIRQSKDLHKKVYESFFAQQKIIFSAPFILSWTGDIDTKYCWVAIKQKTTQRMYIWINSDSKPWLHFGNIIYRDISEQKYLESPMKEYAPYFKNIESFIKQSWIKRDIWYRITVLSELPRWVWMWFDSIFCLLLSTIIYRLQNNTPIHEIDPLVIHEDINNTQHSIYQISRYAQLLESQIIGYQQVSSNILTALCPGKFPIVSFNEDFQWWGKKELVTIQDYRYFIYPLNILFPDIWETPYSPIDYGVIYSGRPTLTEHIYQDSSQKEYNEILNFASSTFEHIIWNSSAQRKPKFYKEILKEHEKGNQSMIHTLLWYNSFEILHKLKTIFSSSYSEEDIKRLLLAITKTRHAHNASKRASSNLTALITCLQQFFWHRPDLLWVSYNDTNTMWWSLFFVTPIEWLRKNILNTIHQAQFDFPWSELLYANRIDWVEENGIICEQDLLQSKKSEYIDSNMLVLELPDKNFMFGAYDYLVQQKEVDIILDTVHWKIYTSWQKLTSKDLHSQTWTIDMLLTALENVWTDISNKELPASSYARSKNDMVGKIIIPLVKLIKEKTQKELPLECYGWMYDYFLRLKKSNVKFGIVRKIAEMEPVK